MFKKSIAICAMSLLCAVWFSKAGYADIVSFNNPGQWLTQRTDSILVKVQLDTSKIPQKKIDFVLSKVENGKKKAVLTKSFKVTDYTQEYYLGSASAVLLGGKDFLRIDWSVPGTQDKGFLFPFGIANLDKIDKKEPIHASKSKELITDKNWASLIAGVKYVAIKGNEVGFMWDQKSIVIVCKKNQSKDILKFVIDAKNGKNAFVSYPDRVIDYFCANDSLAYSFYERFSANDTISYTVKSWQNEIKKYSDSKTCVVVVPWFDLGMLPLDERVIGFAGFATDAKANVLASSPEKAKLLIPGSWGSIVLDK